MWTLPITLVLVTVAIYTDLSQASVCGNLPPIWRNHNITCPERAICADVFETVRDWYNGTRCNEKRILHNCLCPGGSVCPFDNPDHMLYASAQHMMYTCRTACSLPWCGNIRQRNPQSQERYQPVVTYRVEQNAAEFNGGNYGKMECRCPRHHTPYTDRPGVHRSVKVYTHQYNFASHRYATLYECNTQGNENLMADQCAN